MKKYSFWSVTVLSAITSALRLIVLFIINKVVAVFLGTTGFVLMSNMQNVLSMAQSLGGRSLQPGIIRFAPLKNEPLASYLKVSLILSLAGALFIAPLIYIFRFHFFSEAALNVLPQHFFTLLPITIFSASLVTIAITTTQALEYYKKWFLLINSLLIIQFIATIFATTLYHTTGLLVALMIIPIIQLLAIIVLEAPKIMPLITRTTTTKQLRTMAEYLSMGVVSVGITPLALILIRQHLITTVGLETTGLWQGVVRLSELGLMLVTTTFATWYLPQLSKKQKSLEVGSTILKMLFVVGLLTAISGVGAWYIRIPLLSTVFSSQFIDAQYFLGWQMIILFLQALSWVLGSVLLIHGWVKEFMVIEIIGQLISLILALTLLPTYGVYGVFIGYTIEGVLYILYLLFRLRKELWFGFNSIFIKGGMYDPQ